ncbi:MAG TPA: hypothetical protein PKE06_25800 [Flavilitoribacter sp.]|nr:hypothetical protein [Flavilitoribacter sp.]HMQ89194.1 hypothetical protein [Flavilitoribacter sp.]
MKRLIIFALFAAVLLAAACDKESKNYGDFDEGLLLGQDFRRCVSPICSGWFIEINGDTLRFLGFPENSGIANADLDLLPLPVLVKWTPYADPDFADVQGLITVTEIHKQ